MFQITGGGRCNNKKMKRKIISGSILAAFLMISIAFIQPVAAREKQPVEIIQTTEIDMQEVEQLVEMISDDKKIISYFEIFLEEGHISGILEQMQVVTGPDEMYVLLTQLETVLVTMGLDQEIMHLLLESYGTEIAEIGDVIFTIDDFKDLTWTPPWWQILIWLICGFILWLQKWFGDN